MPWNARSAKRHTKEADTPGKKKKWAKIAEGLRKKGMPEGRAIRIANAAVKDRFWDGDHFRYADWKAWLEDRNRRTTRRDPAGRLEGTWEEEDDTEDALTAPALRASRYEDVTPRARIIR